MPVKRKTPTRKASVKRPAKKKPVPKKKVQPKKKVPVKKKMTKKERGVLWENFMSIISGDAFEGKNRAGDPIGTPRALKGTPKIKRKKGLKKKKKDKKWYEY